MEKQILRKRTKETRKRVRERLWTWANTPEMVDKLRKSINEAEDRIRQAIECMTFTPKPPEEAGMPGGNLPGDPTAMIAYQVGGSIQNCREYVEQTSERIRIYRKEAEEIERAIMQLPGLECVVIQLRYKEYGKDTTGYWEKIGRRIHTSTSHAKKLEGKACDRLAEAFKIYSE